MPGTTEGTASAATTPSGSFGADVSTATSERLWQAIFAESNVHFSIVRCYRNRDGGIVDANCRSSVEAAWASGIGAVDVYHFPVLNGKTPEQQVRESLDALSGVDFGRYWLDIEGDWNTEDNVSFIQGLVTAVSAASKQPGIYTGTDAWKTITGGTTAFSTLPLWWASHGNPFAAFGGWAAPLIVQFPQELKASATGDGTVNYDLDQLWSPEE